MQMTKPQQNQTQCRLNAFRVIMITFQVGEAHAISVCVCVCARVPVHCLCYLLLFPELGPLFAVLIKV